MHTQQPRCLRNPEQTFYGTQYSQGDGSCLFALEKGLLLRTLLGVFDLLAPLAVHALAALGRGDEATYRRLGRGARVGTCAAGLG
jgi:hypothetical protein